MNISGTIAKVIKSRRSACLNLDREKKRYSFKNIVISLMIALFILFILCLGISLKVGYALCNPAKKDIKDTPENYHMTYENVVLSSEADGIKLQGWWLPAQDENGIPFKEPSNTTVIFNHGYRGNRAEGNILGLGKSLIKNGYNVLTIDFRNSGESEKSHVTVGIKEKLDAIAGIKYVLNQKHSKNIIMYGRSMGGAVSICGSREIMKNYPEFYGNIKGIVSEGTFADLGSYLKENLSVWSKLPKYPFTNMILSIMPTFYGMHMDECSPVEDVKYISKIPMLLIHSKVDYNIPVENCQKIYDSHPNKSSCQVWITDEGEHALIRDTFKEDYDNRILEFIGNLDLIG